VIQTKPPWPIAPPGPCRRTVTERGGQTRREMDGLHDGCVEAGILSGAIPSFCEPNVFFARDGEFYAKCFHDDNAQEPKAFRNGGTISCIFRNKACSRGMMGSSATCRVMNLAFDHRRRQRMKPRPEKFSIDTDALGEAGCTDGRCPAPAGEGMEIAVSTRSGPGSAASGDCGRAISDG